MVTRIKETIKTKEISKEVKPKKIQEVKPKEISAKKEDNLAKQLIETGVKVQSKTVDLISEMDKLTKRVDKLLGLFEEERLNLQDLAEKRCKNIHVYENQ